VVGAMRDAADVEIGQPLRKAVAVQQYLAFAAGTRLPAEERMLAAGDIGAEIGPLAVGRGNGGVILLHPALHLQKQLVLKRRGLFHRRCRIVVLGFEIGANIGGERLRLTHHLLPVFGAQPGIVIGALLLVMGGGLRPTLRDWRYALAVHPMSVRCFWRLSGGHLSAPGNGLARPVYSLGLKFNATPLMQ
jgi:hypothetical protein